MRYAQIDNGHIINVIVADQNPGVGYVPDPDARGTIGGTWTEAWGFAPPLPAPEPVPEVISDRQLAHGLAKVSRITQDEALAWVGPGTLPAALDMFIAGLPADQQFDALMLLKGATEFRFSHPLSPAIAAFGGMSPEQFAAFWRMCASL